MMDKAITVLIVGLVLTLWNLGGVYSFYHDYTMTSADISKLPAAQAVMYTKMGGWEWVVYAVGTIAGLIGSALIALKKGWAAPVSLVSLVAVAIQFGHTALAHAASSVWTPGAIAFVGFIVLIAAIQWLLARRWKAKGLLA